MSGGQNQISIYDYNGKWADVNTFKAWLSENNVTFLLELETPEEIPLTEEELAAYAALHTNNPNTTIFADGSPEIYVEYYRNTANGEALSEVSEKSNTTASELKLLSDQMNLSFSDTQKTLEEINGSLQEQINTITKYFTFNVDGFTIGQEDNPYKIVIDNDRYSMFVSTEEVLWIDAITKEVHTPGLTVTDRLSLLELLLERDSGGNINCEWVE